MKRMFSSVASRLLWMAVGGFLVAAILDDFGAVPLKER